MDAKKQKLIYLVAAAIAGMAAYILLGPMSGLAEAGQRYIGILVFIVVVWCTEAVSYPVSGLVLIVLMMFAEATGKVKFNQGLKIAVSGFASATPLAIELGKMAGFSTAELVALAWTIYVFCRAAYLLPQKSAQVIIVYDYGYFNRKDMIKMGVRLTLASMCIYMLWGNLVLPYLAK